jgi:acyl-CoA thioesterase
MADLPDVLRVTDMGDGRYDVIQPSESAEGRDVVFSGQYLAQMLMAAEASESGTKHARSIHASFVRAGTYTKPIELQVEVVHSGRTWGTDTITAYQDGRILSRAMVLLTAEDPDLMNHQAALPADVPGPDGLAADQALVFPGVEWRPVPGEHTVDGVPALFAWHRFEQAVPTAAANQAVLAYGTTGQLIGLAMSAHRDAVSIEMAHRTLSTGVIGHTIHFLQPFDVSQWLLVSQSTPKTAAGRVFGRGLVHTQDGQVVAEFSQDAMAKTAEGQLDYGRSM